MDGSLNNWYSTAQKKLSGKSLMKIIIRNYHVRTDWSTSVPGENGEQPASCVKYTKNETKKDGMTSGLIALLRMKSFISGMTRKEDKAGVLL